MVFSVTLGGGDIMSAVFVGGLPNETAGLLCGGGGKAEGAEFIEPACRCAGIARGA